MEIKKTNETKGQRFTVLVYGQSGVGKTTLAKTLKGKTLIISAESGLLSLAGDAIDYVELKGSTALQKINSLKEILVFLLTETEYQNVFIDSLSEIGQIIVEYNFDKINNDRSKSLVAWGEYAKQIRSLIKTFRDLAPYNIVFTALDKADKDEYSRRFICPDLNGAIAQQVPQFFDEVFYYTTITKEDKTHRVLLTSPNNGAIAKDRSGKLNQVEVPDLGDIFERIKNVQSE